MTSEAPSALKQLTDDEQARLYRFCSGEPYIYGLLRRLVTYGVQQDPPTPDETPAPLTYDEFWKQVGLTGWNPSAEEMKTLLTIVGCRCTKCEYHRSAEKTSTEPGNAS